MKQLQTWILKLNAAFLVGGSLGGLFLLDIPGMLASGPARAILGPAPYLAIGFLEAHCLAFVIAMLLWHGEPKARWHFTALSTELILGTCNILCWQLFVVTGTLVMGYLTTSLHWIFAALQLVTLGAAARRTEEGRDAMSRASAVIAD